MPPASKTTQWSKLREPFPVDKVKQRPGGGGKTLDYVPIETVLERLLDAAPDYSWEAELAHLYVDGDLAVVQGTLTIGNKKAFGIGAMRNQDIDMAVKSANSEAMKNAAKNGFGVALELWDAEYREELAAARESGAATVAESSDLQALKNRVADLAVTAGVERTGPAIASHFGVTIEALQSRETLEHIVAQSIAE
jgi:hypothetical protein